MTTLQNLKIPVLAKSIMRFCIVHLIINMLNYIVTYVHFISCYNLHSNIFMSFVYSCMYSNSEYCITLGSLMQYTTNISRTMWHTVYASICIETIRLANLKSGLLKNQLK